MPQLNPDPWFFIMAMSWLTFLFIVQPKSMSFTPFNSPFNLPQYSKQSFPWPWPWT